MNESEITKKLEELLKEAVKKNCSGQEKVGIIFSGGLDSSIIAFLATKFTEVKAYTVGSEDFGDLEFVEMLIERNLVDFEVKIKEIKRDEVEQLIPKVLEIIKDTNPIQVSCAIPVYFAAKEARNDDNKLKVMFMGQGGDELFGGYNRYLKYTNNEKKLEKILKRDVENSYEDNLNRDIKMCKANDIELRLPYLDENFKNFALNIPVNLKIKEVKEGGGFFSSCIDQVDGKKIVRKYILRKVAEKIGVPDVVIERPKKALQYGSGSLKILKKIAKGEGFKGNDYMQRYLEKVLNQKD